MYVDTSNAVQKTGDTMTGCLIIKPGSEINGRQGIRINSSDDGYASIILGGNDEQGYENNWEIATNNSDASFYIRSHYAPYVNLLYGDSDCNSLYSQVNSFFVTGNAGDQGNRGVSLHYDDLGYGRISIYPSTSQGYTEAWHIFNSYGQLRFGITSESSNSWIVPLYMTQDNTVHTNKLYGAVWNDYAEYRNQTEEIKPGYCVASADDGKIYKTTEKFQACDGITSDTFGFAIGETDDCKTPLAVAGRVLAYCEGNRYDYHSGDTVCAGPEGKVVKMTREEIREWPDRIVGVVSEIPEYETWGSGDVEVDGRIWIKVK